MKGKKERKNEIYDVIKSHTNGISNESIAKIVGITQEYTAAFTRELYLAGKIDQPRSGVNIVSNPWQNRRVPQRTISRFEVYDLIKQHPDGLTNYELIKMLKIEDNGRQMDNMCRIVSTLGKGAVIIEKIVAPERTKVPCKRAINLYRVNGQYIGEI